MLLPVVPDDLALIGCRLPVEALRRPPEDVVEADRESLASRPS